MASSFDQPARLSDIPSTSSPTVLSASVSVLSIPPAPRFADFRFQNIGRQPQLLARFTDYNQAQDGTEDESMSPSSDSDQRLQNAEQNAMPRSRPSLWQALAEQDAVFAANGNPIGQVSANTSRLPVIEASASDEQQPGPAEGRSTPQPDISTSSTFSRSLSPFHTASQLSVPASSANFDGNAVRQNSVDSLPSMNLGYPSASSGPSGADDALMEDMRPSCAAIGSSLPPSSREYEGLRQILSCLQAIALPHDYKPNLASALLLAGSAQQKADVACTEVRTLHSSTQELLQGAQKAHIAASALLKDVEEAKGLADGAKAEIERISSAYTDQQSQSGHNQINELLQSLENWIVDREANEADLRAQRARQPELTKQKMDLTRVSIQPSVRLSSASPLSVTGPSTSTTTPISASAPQKQTLFCSPTPQVDIKVDLRTWSQYPLHPSPASVSTASDPSQRQVELRKLLKEKHRLPDEQLLGSSSRDAVRGQQRRLEEERQEPLEEARRKQFEEVGIRREQEDKRRGSLWRAKEEQRQEEQEQREPARQGEEGKNHEEMERRSREEMEKKAREEGERLREEEEKRAREEAEKKRARESLEAIRKARAEADGKKALEEAERKTREAEAQRRARKEELEKKAQEEAKRKAQEEAGRKVQEEAQKKRPLLIQHRQEEELQAELRLTRERIKEEQRKSEEQARLTTEQERQEKLHQDQNMQRVQIQAEKDKTMADHAQQVLAQRSHHLQSSLDGTSEMCLDSSPAVPTFFISKPPLASPLASQGLLTQHSPLIQRLPQGAYANGSTISNQASTALNGQTPTSVSLQGNPPDPRSFSLPPVTYLSQSERSPSAASTIPPSQRTPTLSVYSLSGDSGNVPYRANNLQSSPQAQAANIRHVVSALNLQPLTLVKTESAHDDSKLLYPPSRDRTPIQHQIAREPLQKPALRHPQIYSPNLQQQQSTAPLSASAGQPSPLSAEPTNGSHTHIILDRRIPSSPAVTEFPHSRSHQSQQPQQPQQTSAFADPIPGQPQIQAPNPPASATGAQSQPSHRQVSRNEAQQKLILSSASQINGRSRSSSPFRMGPDAYVAPQLTTDSSPPDTNWDSCTAPTGPALRGRHPLSTSTPSAHWDHYSPSPQRPRSPLVVSRPRSPPPRQTDTYGPGYSERARSPVLVGRKRSREGSPGYYIRDYWDRDHDDRRAPSLRRSCTPPRRVQSRRTPSRSRSPSPGSPSYRPSLATRLGQGPPPPNDYSYLVTPKDWGREREPNLLSRFSDTRTAGPLLPKPGRARGKRGRGGGGGPPNNHASLGERISSSLTLAKRIREDVRRP